MTIFDPVKFSLEENKFLLKHLGEPSVVALSDIRPARLPEPNKKDKNPIYYPEGVTPAAVKPALDGIYELIELERHQGQEWIGLEALKGAISTYIEQAEKWAAQKGMRGAPRFPSMYAFDSRGRAHLGAVGSDSGQVRTYFDKDGNRIPFAIHLRGEQETWKPDWIAQTVAIPTKTLVENDEAGRWECFCGHTEKFSKESRSSKTAARARMSKHMRRATDSVDDHRELHTQEFS